MATKLRIENGKWKINASFNRFRRAGHAGAASLALADNLPSDLIPPYNDNRHVFINGYRVNINRIPTITHIIGGLLGKTAGWGHPALQYICYQSIKSVVTYTHFIVGCDDLGAPHLTIGTRIIVGATIGRPQRDRSLRKERPRTRLIITWEANGLPYGVDYTDQIEMVRRGRTPGHLLLRHSRNSPCRTLRYTYSI
mgnify:FL=1